MEAQETTATDYLFKLWPWFEANAKRIAFGAALALIAIFIWSFYSYRQSQRETAAGEALTQATMSTGGTAEACLKIATDYSGTAAGQRALLQGATALFTDGKYADAQAQFQKFLDAYPENFFAPQAALGVAASLDAQGKTDLAVGAYQRAAGMTANGTVAAAAKFALARIDETQGKAADAMKLYAEVARGYPNTSISSEAGRRAMELKIKSPAAVAPAPAPATSVPFNLSH